MTTGWKVGESKVIEENRKRQRPRLKMNARKKAELDQRGQGQDCWGWDVADWCELSRYASKFSKHRPEEKEGEREGVDGWMGLIRGQTHFSCAHGKTTNGIALRADCWSSIFMQGGDFMGKKSYCANKKLGIT